MNDHQKPEAGQLARFSIHRPSALQLPDDPQLATAAVLAYVNGAEGVERAAAIEALTARAAALADADPDEAIKALAAHLPVLNSLWLRFAAESASASSPVARAAFLKLALNAQGSYARCQALVIGLRLQTKGKAHVALNDDDGDDS